MSREKHVPGKIKIIYAYASFYRNAGGEMHPLFLAEGLNKSEFDFSICVIENSRSAIRMKIEASGCRIHDLNLSRRFYNPLNAIRIVSGFRRLFKAERPQIVQTQALHANLFARLAAKLAGVPRVVSTENSLPAIETNKLRRMLNAMLHWLNRGFDRFTHRIVVVSEQLRNLKAVTGTASKIEVIPPPFDLDSCEMFRSSGREFPPFENPSRVTIGVVGRLSSEKGHRFLIAAMPEILRHMPKARLKLYGTGPAEHSLRRLAAELQVSEAVGFEGYRLDIFDELNRLDALFVPSLSDAFPIVILEGLAMELPVVGTSVDGIPEMIRHRITGLLVPPADSSALVGAFNALASAPDMARRMGQKGRQWVLSQCHPKRFVAMHESLYRELSRQGG